MSDAFSIVSELKIGEVYLVQRRLNGPRHSRFEPARILDIVRSKDSNYVYEIGVRFLFDDFYQELGLAIGTVRKITNEWINLQQAIADIEIKALEAKSSVLHRLLDVNTQSK